MIGVDMGHYRGKCGVDMGHDRGRVGMGHDTQ